MKPITSAILTALVCTSASLVVQHARAESTGTPSPLDQLNDFIGQGACSGNTMATDKTPGHASVGHYRGEKTLDGNWIVIHYDEDQTAQNPKPFHVAQYFGYDAKKKQFVSVTFDNSGGTYTAGISSGWKDNAFTVDDTTSMDGKNVNYRDVFTKNGTNGPSHAGMMRGKNGTWTKTDEETCHNAQ